MSVAAARPRDALDRFGLPGLAFAAGGVDAASYLGLGHAFPANMTGNTVLLGVAIARADGQAGVRSAVVLAGFALGVVLGLALRGGSWPDGAAPPLIAHALLMTTVFAVWAVVGAPSGPTRIALLGAAGAAMGLQSVATRGSGVATTYMTGTLTNALAGLSGRIVKRGHSPPPSPRQGQRAGEVWVVYGAGALIGALIETRLGAIALALPSAIIVTTAALAWAADARD